MWIQGGIKNQMIRFMIAESTQRPGCTQYCTIHRGSSCKHYLMTSIGKENSIVQKDRWVEGTVRSEKEGKHIKRRVVRNEETSYWKVVSVGGEKGRVRESMKEESGILSNGRKNNVEERKGKGPHGACVKDV